jgi:hypothetical protein
MCREEIANAIWRDYLLGGAITRLGREIVGSAPAYLKPEDFLKILAYWRTLISSIVATAQESTTEELQLLAQLIQRGGALTEGQVIHRLWAKEAENQTEQFLQKTWGQGRKASKEEIDEFTYSAISLAGDGRRLTRGQGIAFVTEISSCNEACQARGISALKNLYNTAEYDAISVTCHLSPLLTRCTSQSFVGLGRSFEFDLAKEMAFQKAALRRP